MPVKKKQPRALEKPASTPKKSVAVRSKLESVGTQLKNAAQALAGKKAHKASAGVGKAVKAVKATAGRTGSKSALHSRAATRVPRKRGPRADPSAVEQRLTRALPTAFCELEFSSPFELLVATILAAQSTDKMINAVMPELLAVLPDVFALAAAEQEQVEQLVKRSGFFRNKAKAIRGAAQQLVERHGGEVPRTLEELVALPGVARKTANVVLGTAYRIPSGFIVDTHVMRVAQRLGLSSQTDPVKIEDDLTKLFPRESWIELGHRLTLHGRYTCVAKTPLCSVCPLNELCPSRLEEPRESWQERADAEASRVSAQTRLSRTVNSPADP